MADTGKETVLLCAERLGKSYGEAEVLREVSLSLRAGEVRAILGENGAGKSTLVKILSGFEQASTGSLTVAAVASEGESGTRTFAGWNVREAEAAGVMLIHQELNLVDQLTVTENVFLGRELRRGWFVDRAGMTRRTQACLASLRCKVDPQATVGELPVSIQQLIEIARAIADNGPTPARVLIMDEPTAVLTGEESEVLYDLIARLSARGVAIVFISHRLQEIERVADSITILRDGRLVGDFAVAQLSREQMIGHMAGREISALFPARHPPASDAPVALEVRNLRVRGTDRACSFALKQGEILGFSGLAGSGRTALLETVVGLRWPAGGGGTIRVHGRVRSIRSLAQARTLGIVYLTKDRKGKGLLPEKDLVFNFSLLALSKFARLLVDTAREARAFGRAVNTFGIGVRDGSMAAGSLSGGNQQKLLLARILEAEPGIIIMDEPTRGIDIGTRTRIYRFISDLATAGHAIVVISSDITEVIGLSHRVAVMYRGQLTGLLEGNDINEETILAHAMGLQQQARATPESSGQRHA